MDKIRIKSGLNQDKIWIKGHGRASSNLHMKATLIWWQNLAHLPFLPHSLASITYLVLTFLWLKIKISLENSKTDPSHPAVARQLLRTYKYSLRTFFFRSTTYILGSIFFPQHHIAILCILSIKHWSLTTTTYLV